MLSIAKLEKPSGGVDCSCEVMCDGVAPPLIVGVCLANKAGPAHSHPLTTITLPPSHLSHPLTELRALISAALLPSLQGRSFIFLSLHGWDVPAAMETHATIEQVFQTDTHSVSLRFSHPQPRVGLVAEATPTPLALGFISCDLGVALPDLHREIESQLPRLYSALVATGYSVLDANGWPIGREQESLFSLAEVLADGTVHLTLSSQKTPEVLASSVVKATPAALPPATRSSRGSVSPDPAHSLRPIAEETADRAESSILSQSLSSDIYISAVNTATPGGTQYEILLSYVHREASDEAISLREALQKEGYRVFLDVECIRSGTDWQDVLNDAVSQCTVFIPLITEQYGQTLWTNREVKLADVLGKIIVPVNLLARWPPQCLAIQFATTQYVSWPHSNTNMEWNGEVVARVTKEIVERYGVETSVLGEMGDGVIKVDGEGGEEEEVEEIVTMDAEERHQSFARADTLRISEEREGVRSGGISLPVPQLLSQRRSTIKSYASVLPSSLPLKYRKSIQESRVGKPLVVISCHTAQQEYAREVSRDMEGCGYETWCSCDILHLPVENASPIFQLRANEAGAVVFIFSKEFTENSFCENQVYYCEQRKSIIPVVYEPIQLPHWICLLIGTSPFISCQSSDHRQQLVERVRDALNPVKREVSLRAMLQEKAQVARLRAEVTATLPKGRSLVYISGGTHFYSEHGEEICQQLGRRLAQDSSVVLVTGGFFGVGETVGRSFHEERERLGGASEVWHIIAERDDQDKSSQTRQNEDGSFPALPYGKTIFAGSSVRQREMITPHVVKVAILVEGGPGAAFEAQQFSWNGNYIIPVRMTGGAAGGLFNVPEAIFQRPPAIDQSDWSVLGNSEATPTQVASALVRIVKTLHFVERAGCRSPGNKRAESRGGVQRSETYTYSMTTELPPHSLQKKKKRSFSDTS